MGLSPRRVVVFAGAAVVAASILAQVTIVDSDRGGALDLGFEAAPVPPYSPVAVSALAVQADGRILLGNMYGLFRLQSSGALDEGFRFAGFPVNAIALLPEGRMFVGGVGCFPSAALAEPLHRLLPDGTRDAFSPNLSCGTVTVLASPDHQTVVAAGTLLFASGSQRALARFLADGALDPGFVAPPELPPPTVLAAQPDGKVLAGWANGPPTLVRLLTNGALDAAFQPRLSYASPTANDAGVRSLLVQPDGKIVVSGHFRFAHGVARTRLARLNPDGSLDPTFNPGAGLNASAASLARQADGKIILGGRFTSVDGVACNQVARLNPDGSLDQSFEAGTGPNGLVDKVLVQPDGHIRVAGAFDRFNAAPRKTLVRLMGGAPPPRFTGIARRPGDVTELRFEGARCPRYLFETSTDLRSWQPWSTNEPVEGGHLPPRHQCLTPALLPRPVAGAVRRSERARQKSATPNISKAQASAAPAPRLAWLPSVGAFTRPAIWPSRCLQASDLGLRLLTQAAYHTRDQSTLR